MFGSYFLSFHRLPFHTVDCVFYHVCLFFWASLIAQLVGKVSACNAGDPSSIPRLGRSPGEGIDYPLQYSWASIQDQKNFLD